jgi:pyruvate kinase
VTAVPDNRYTIVATLGPASTGAERIAGLAAAGADAFRLNTSHLDLRACRRWLGRLSRPAAGFPGTLPVILDLQGSKWRLGRFPRMLLAEGSLVELVCAAGTTHGGRLPVPHQDFFAAAPASSADLLLDDARILLRIEEAGTRSLRARVVLGGSIQERKGITFARSSFRREELGERDRSILECLGGAEDQSPRIAVSYVRDAAEMRSYRDLIRRLVGGSVHLIAKLERETALEEARGIAAAADELWLCRGDLGAEMGLRRMAEAVFDFASAVRALPVPVLLAGQVLQHMTGSPHATRAELCGLYDALREGFSGVVLSDETAIGDFPVESCRAAAIFR